MQQIKTLFKKYGDFISYLLVGVIATVVEWIFFWLFNGQLNWHHQIATVAAMILSTFANWLAGRLITFKDAPKDHILLEIAQVYGASVIGILLNMLLMWLFVDVIHIPGIFFVEGTMVSKMLATMIVFVYNYLIRKLYIYKDNHK